MPSRKFLIDAAERIGWQVGYAALTSVIVYASHLSYTWAPALMVALNLLKVILAQHVGNPDTAAIGGEKTPAPVEQVTPLNSTGGAA